MAFVSSGGSLVELSRPSINARPLAITSYTGLTTSYEAIFRSQPNVRTVVDFVARNVAQLPIRLMRRVSERERRHERDHPFDRFLRSPSPRATRYELINDLLHDLLIFDRAYGLKARIAGVDTLIRYPARWVEPLGGMYPHHYRLLAEPGQPEWPADRVLDLHGYSPDGDANGVSPIETLRRILAEDIAAGEYREQFWGNHARTSAVIRRPLEAPKWTEDAKRRFEAGFGATWAGRGPGAGGTPVLEEGMELIATGQSAQESEYLGARKLTRSEVASAYFMAPAMVGIMENTNFSNMDIQHRMLYQDGLGPTLTFLSLALWLQVLPDFAPRSHLDELEVEFQLEEKLRGSFVEESEAMTRAVGGPWMTRAEGRAKSGLPPLDEDQGAEELIVPLNVTAGGRPNPLDTNLPTVDNEPGAVAALARPRGRARRAVKAATSPANPSLGWVEQHEAQVGRFLDRQASTVIGRLAGGELPATAFDAARWNAELAEDLFGLALSLAPEAAEPIAERFAIVYNLEAAEAWLSNNARIAAEEFNAATANALADAYAAIDLEVEPIDHAREAFQTARGQRAAQLAHDRAVGIANFSRHDAASQAGATTKTWHVASTNPRPSHASLSGVTIPIGTVFANGAKWPGDTSVPPWERCGCTCTVDFTEADLTEELEP